MFDVGWSEMAVIALVALVVLGPKELPQAMKTFASFTRKMQRYARDFRSGVDNIIREAELDDAKKALDAVRVNPKSAMQKLVDPTGETLAAVSDVEKAARDKGDSKPAIATPVDAKPVETKPAEAKTDGPSAAAEAAPSNVIIQPTNMAPPHSIRPPAPREPVPVAKREPAPEPARAKVEGGEPPAGETT